MLSFLSPWFLIGAAAAALPIVLHLLKREPEPRVKFPAVRLLKHAPVEYTEKRRLRELLLLALRVTALVLVAVAFARPFLTSATAGSSVGTTIVALDTSYSMSAPGVFERARALARGAVNRAGAGELVGVVTFADWPALVAKPSIDRALARSAIDAAAPGFGATRYRGAIGAAVQALAGSRGTIVVVTDLQESGWESGDRVAVPESTRVQVLDAGSIRSNLAVTAVRTTGGRVVATVRNSGDETREVRAHLDLDGRRAGDAETVAGPHASVDVALGDASNAAVAAVSVDDPGGLSADDVRYAVLGTTGRPSVLIVTPEGEQGREGFYVRQAVSVGPVDRAFEPVVIDPGQLSSMDSGRLSLHIAVILLSTRGLEHRGRQALAAYLTSGGGLLVAAGPDLDGEIVADVLGDDRTFRLDARAEGESREQSLAPEDARHPLFRSFDGDPAALGLVKFHRVARIQGPGCRSLARFTTGEAALLDCVAGDGHAIVLASDLDNRWNDFPRRATFVPFLHDALRYLGSHRSLETGYVVADVPAGVPPSPGVATLPVAAGAGGEVRTGGTDAGVGPTKGRARRVAVNVDPRESDLTRITPAGFQRIVERLKDTGATTAKAEARQQEAGQHLWMYVIALALAVLAVEGLVASRAA